MDLRHSQTRPDTFWKPPSARDQLVAHVVNITPCTEGCIIYLCRSVFAHVQHLNRVASACDDEAAARYTARQRPAGSVPTPQLGTPWVT